MNERYHGRRKLIGLANITIFSSSLFSPAPVSRLPSIRSVPELDPSNWHLSEWVISRASGQGGSKSLR